MARSYIDNWDYYAKKETRSNKLGFDFVARQTEHEGVTCTISKVKVPGMTL